MNKLLFATSNPHKLREVREIFLPLGIEVDGLDVLPQALEEPVEDGATFAANAELKAAGYARASGRRCLADDSGLEVDALGGRPGIHSARYAGHPGDRAQRDAANNAKLLTELAGIPAEKRSARFVCAMCICDPDGSVLAHARGTFEGIITEQPRGEGGFGYDPLLWLPDSQCTSAELSAEQKHARSHRGAATRAIVQRLTAD